jgi:hypothetical protein
MYSCMGRWAGAAFEEMLDHVEAMIDQVEVLVHVVVEEVNGDTSATAAESLRPAPKSSTLEVNPP